MIATRTLMPNTSEAGIFGRLLTNGKGAMSHQLARYVLTLGFDSADQVRMEELATRNQENRLSREERHELMNYVRAGHLLALLHSKARKSLQKRRKVS